MLDEKKYDDENKVTVSQYTAVWTWLLLTARLPTQTRTNIYNSGTPCVGHLDAHKDDTSGSCTNTPYVTLTRNKKEFELFLFV